MTSTVDLVIVGATARAAAAAMAGASQGRRVLVVMRATDGRFGRRLRRSLRAAGNGLPRLVQVLTGVEMVCADGVHALEAVVLRRIRNGRLIAVNASALIDLRS